MVGKLLHVPVPGVRLDRIMVIAIPKEVAEQLDEDLFAFVDDPQLDEDEEGPAEGRGTDERRPIYVGGTIPRDERPSDDDAPRVKELVPLSPADPFLFTQTILCNLWEEAMESQGNSTRPLLVHRTIPVGQYELAVIPTGNRARSRNGAGRPCGRSCRACSRESRSRSSPLQSSEGTPSRER